jgi:hypothetical protein
MTNSYKSNLKRGKLKRNLASFLFDQDELYGFDSEESKNVLQKRFEKIKKNSLKRDQ